MAQPTRASDARDASRKGMADFVQSATIRVYVYFGQIGNEDTLLDTIFGLDSRSVRGTNSDGLPFAVEDYTRH